MVGYEARERMMTMRPHQKGGKEEKVLLALPATV